MQIKSKLVEIIIPEFYRAIRFWTRIIFYILLLAALSVLSGVFTKEQLLSDNPWLVVCILGMICLFYCTMFHIGAKEGSDFWLHLLGCFLGFIMGAVVFLCCFDLLFQLTIESLWGCAVFVGVEVIVDGIRSIVNRWWLKKNGVIGDSMESSKKEDTSSGLTDAEKWLVSCHEAGHALVAELINGIFPVQHVSIGLQKNGSLGRTELVEDAAHCHNKRYYEFRIAIYTAGRAAEEILLGSSYDGASHDIWEATCLAKNMVMRYGMSKELGMIVMTAKHENNYLQTEPLFCSEALRAKADQLVIEIIQSQYEVARKLLQENKDLLEKLARLLSKKEAISGDELREFIQQNK